MTEEEDSDSSAGKSSPLCVDWQSLCVVVVVIVVVLFAGVSSARQSKKFDPCNLAHTAQYLLVAVLGNTRRSRTREVGGRQEVLVLELHVCA